MINPALRMFLLSIGLVGAILYSVVLILTFLNPTWLERVGSTYIEDEVLKTIDLTIDSVRPPTGKTLLDKAARKLYEVNSVQIKEAKEQLRTGAYKVFVDAIAQIRDLSCDCRSLLEQKVASQLRISIAAIESMNENLAGFVQRSYASVMQQIRRDVRIFSSVNLLAFLGLLGALIAKPQASVQLVVPSTLLAISALVCSFFYVFEQNWLMTIVHNDYVGFGYLAWLAVVFGFLLDSVVNRARMTSAIINAVASAVGSTFEVSPC